MANKHIWIHNSHYAVDIPDDIIVRILNFLPVKSLFRFSCVSRQWHFIILSDPQFAKSHFKIASEQKTLGCRRLLRHSRNKFNLLDLERPSSVRTLSCPFKTPGHNVDILCSGNGLVCAKHDGEEIFYVWNPSTGLFKQLPDPPVLSKPYEVIYHGCGYLSATDDYKFLVARIEEEEEEEEELEEEEKKVEVDIFSWRAQVWKRIQVPKEDSITREGILLNEALHWLGEGGKKDTKDILFAFDLGKEEFRKMPLPILDEGGKLFSGITVSLGGCLCLYRFFTAEHCAKYFAKYSSSIDMWVMRKYDVGDSWTKLCRLKFSNIPNRIRYPKPLLVMEDSTVVGKWTCTINPDQWIRSGYDGEVLETYENWAGGIYTMEYEESLLRWPVSWSKPPLGFLKVNCDGVFDVSTATGGIGFICRNDVGEVVAGKGEMVANLQSGFHAEMLAAHAALHFISKFLSRPQVILETDCSELITSLAKREADLSSLGVLIEDVKLMLKACPNVSLCHVCMESNNVAHCLAKQSLFAAASFSWFGLAPEFLYAPLSNDGI